VRKAQGYVNEGYVYVVDIDLEKFFDQVNHDRLMGTLAKRVKDKRMLRLIRAYLNAGVMEDGLVTWTTQGTPQGGPLSPLLSNIVLDEWDRELEKRGHKFVRYADDCNIYVRSKRAGERVMKSMNDFITKKLKLKVNEQKSAVGLPQERQILGFTILNGKRVIRLISPKAIKRFKDRIRKGTRETKETMKERVGRLATYMRGWVGYYGFCETPSTLRDLEAWVRRRLRCLIWKQWQDSRRYRELRRRGIGQWQAWNIANGSKGPWRASRSIAMGTTYPKDYFYQMGLPKMTVWEMA
jgi:RNA-directed DNA polymerase